VSEITTTAQNNTQAVDSNAAPIVTPSVMEAAPVVTPPVEAKVDATINSTVTDGAKPVEAAAPVVPEKYDLKLPDGALLDSVALEEISAYAKEKGYTQEQAQELLQRENDAILDYTEKSQESHRAQVLKWKQEVMADKEIGGEQFNINIEYAHRVLQKFAPKEFVQTLEKSGYGNHPLLVKTFVAIGKAMQPDKIVKSDSIANTKTYEELFYGNQN
jgi:hypothetical protein